MRFVYHFLRNCLKSPVICADFQKLPDDGSGRLAAAPDQQNFGVQGFLQDGPDSQPLAEVFHGFWENGGGKTLLCPLHGVPGIVADT